MELKFPDGFLWGSATSAHQVEGGNFNDWTEWEKQNAKRLVEKAKKQWHPWQQERFPEMFDQQNYISGQACDHYNRFEYDFDIAKSLSQNSHRFSIEWSRIEPEEGKFNEAEIEHYRQVILALKQRGIEPFVTLWHWTNPVWFAKKGGWLSKDAAKFFGRYCSKIIDSFGAGLVKFWITLNEPIIYASHSYLRGLWPPQKKNIFSAFRAVDHLAKVHRLAYWNLHAVDRNCQVGVAKHDIYYKSHSISHYFDDSYFVNKVKGQQDFTAINYYFYFSLFKKKNLPVSDLGWGIYPEGLYHVLEHAKKYKRPIYITESGLADIDDKIREQFIKEHLKNVQKAISEGVDVRGYFYWSLLDNFEWDKGFWPRFGLVEVDYKTLERKIRPSAYEYAKICKNNSLIL